jgi:hypothetical protein
MRKTFAVALIAVAAGAYGWSQKPEAPFLPPEDQPARLISEFEWRFDADWFGGLSGLELDADGQQFHAVTDRGQLLRGTLRRQDGRLTEAVIADHKPLVDDKGQVRPFPHTDAEDLALDAQGRLYVSFEHAHRVLRYDTWDAPAIWPSYTRAWRALARNGGLETLAVDMAETLYAIPEGVANGAWEALVYRRYPDRTWQQAFTLPLDIPFVPVSGDFGPDGRFYLLERDFRLFGFRSRVRSMTVLENGFEDIRTELETPLFRHGNLEGLAVWQDDAGRIRLTMISDDNFLWFLPSQIVEYILTD